jgi:hypothetical protein
METNVSGRMQFANGSNPALATEPKPQHPRVIQSARRLVAVQLALLHHMRDAIDEEIRRLALTEPKGN